jgi:membrane associated rhomboid family serine protease
MNFMKRIARRLLTLLAAVVVGALLGGLVGAFFMGGWGEGIIFGGIGGAVLGMLYDPRAATYTVPTRGGAEYPGNRDDRAP